MTNSTVPIPTVATTALTRRGQISAWYSKRTEGVDDFVMPDLTDEAYEVFSQDADMVREVFQEFLRDVLNETGARVFAGRRSQIRAAAVFERPVRAGRTAKGIQWNTWFEHVGKRTMALLAMTRDDLLVAAEERERRAAGDVLTAQAWRMLADKMEPGQRVGERFTEADLTGAFLAVRQQLQ